MPVTPTYPGIYIEELPSSARTITAVATSIAVFVGYTHPFKTKNFNQAVRVFNFTEYEREFGGLYRSQVFDQNVAYAVNQFFLNGGSDAYVIGLEPKYYDIDGNQITTIDPSTITQIGGIVFTPLEPTDRIQMRVTITNRQASNPAPGSPLDTADIIITYGDRVETYRGVTLNSSDTQNFIENRLGTTANKVSSLMTVSPVSGGYGTTIALANQVSVTNPRPSTFATTFKQKDFLDVFKADTALDKIPIFNLLVVPGVADNSIWSNGLSFCERKQAFFILDPPVQAAADTSSAPLPLIADLMDSVVPKSQNGAIYFPYLRSQDPLTSNIIELPPSGFVAGIYARTDLNRGVWKAPAGLETIILNITGVVERGKMTDARQGTLNPKGINCLRSFPGVGTVVFGARTLVAENTALQQWKYVPVRRMALFLEQTLYRNLGWVVFEPNDEPLWVAIRTSIERFMLSLFNQGAFQGDSPSKAFQVKCDSSTTTQQDIDNGIVNIIVAFAPLKPAEFVIVKIAQLAGQVQA